MILDDTALLTAGRWKVRAAGSRLLLDITVCGMVGVRGRFAALAGYVDIAPDPDEYEQSCTQAIFGTQAKSTRSRRKVVRVSVAVVVPGGKFGPAAGLLMYAGAVAERRGATVYRHSWSGEPPNPFEPETEGWVCAEVGRVLDAVGGSPLLIGKSLGTYAAALAAERGLPAVWLTPVLTMPWVAAAMARATAPCLIVGGTGDAMWDSALAHQLSRHVLEIEGADHGMSLPGPLTETIAALDRVVVEMDGFLDTIDWTG